MRRVFLRNVILVVMAVVVGLPNGVVILQDASEVDEREWGTVGYVDDGEVVEGERGNEWEIETVDSSTGGNIAIDSNNRPHIIYSSDENSRRKHAYRDEDEWKFTYIDPEGITERGGPIAFDSNDRLHISHIGLNDTYLKYTHYNGDQWIVETVDYSVDCAGISLVIDNLDRPHIGYYDEREEDLRYAYYDGTIWHIEVVDSIGTVGRGSKIAMDAVGGIHICYNEFKSPYYSLKYAFFNGEQWDIKTLDSKNGIASSIAVDSYNRPHISYYDSHNKSLIHTYYSGNLWIRETVDSEGMVGLHTSIAIDSCDHIHIIYFDSSNRDLKYAYYNGNKWQNEKVNVNGNIGCMISLAVDTYNRPHISYVNADTSTLIYTVIPDNVLPSLDADNSPFTCTTGDEFYFNISASDNYDVGTVSVEWDHGESGENLPLSMNGSYWTSSVTLEHSIESLKYIIHITDVFGNEYVSETQAVEVADNDLPSLIVDESPEGGTTGDEFQFSIKASDNIGVDRVYTEWFQDESNGTLSLDLNGGFWFGIITLRHRIEDFVYKIRIVDTAENTYYSAYQTIKVIDDDPPQFIGDESDSEAKTGENFNFSARFEDNIGVVEVDVYYNFDGAFFATEMIGPNSGSIWNRTVITLMDPTNLSYYFIAFDDEGNEINTFDGFGEFSVEVVDSIRPTAAAGDNGEIAQFQDFTFDGSKCSDNDVIANYTWSFEYNGSEHVLYGEEVRHAFDIPGNYTIILLVRDKAGNIGVDMLNVSVIKVVVGDDDNDDDVTLGDEDGNGTVEGQGGSGILVWVVVIAVVVALVVVGAIILFVVVMKKGGKEK